MKCHEFDHEIISESMQVLQGACSTGGNKGEGSVLGGLGNLLDGD